AVIIATGVTTDGFTWDGRSPAPLAPLVDRPFIQHVVEHLVSQDVREFDWVLSHLPEEIEQVLGTGERWGARFRYHLVRDPFHPYEGLKALGGGEDDLILFGHADRLPAMRLGDVAEPSRRGPVLYAWCEAHGGSEQATWRWSGWAVTSM